MIDRKRSSNNEQDDSSKYFHKNDNKNEQTSNSNSRIDSETSKNKSGFAFSLGSRVLLSSCNENSQIRSLFKKKETLKNNTSILENKRSSSFHAKTNAFKIKTQNRRNSKPRKSISEIVLNQSMNSKKEKINFYITELKENEPAYKIADIYKKYDDSIEPSLIKKLKEVDNCSILRYGVKPSTIEISYSYCLTCDSSLINPICIPCLKFCHKNHIVKEKYKVGNIICSCGERSHLLTNIDNKNSTNIINECLCSEWGKISKLNICYININSKSAKKYLCMLCYNFCISDKSKFIPIFCEPKEGEDFPKCNCSNKYLHSEIRFILNIIEKMTANYKKYDGLNLLHPTQVINAFISSKNSFQHNCKSFYQLFSEIKNNSFENSLIHYSLSKIDFYSTNCFLIMKCLLNIISFNNHTNISYYSEEVENYFSFEIIQSLFENLKTSKLKEKSIWILSYKYLNLFKKVYIANKTQIFDKYKLEDLDNFSSCQRFSLYYKNEKEFPQCKKIVEFLFNYLEYINIKGFTAAEALSCVGEILGILKKLASFNFLSNSDIIRLLQEIEKFFSNMNTLRNFTRQFNKKADPYKILMTKTENDIQSDDTNELNENIEKDISSLEYESDNLESPGSRVTIFFDEEIPLYYTIIKMFRILYFVFNDRLVHKIINDDTNYPNSEDLFNQKKISFGYMKNDFGKKLFKITIKILYGIYKYNKNKGKNNYPMIQKILYHGIKLLEYSLIQKDSYLISLIRSFINGEFYEKQLNSLSKLNDVVDSNNSSNEFLNSLIQEKNNLDKYNRLFLNFEISKEEFITNYGKSLDKVFNGQYKDNHIVGFNKDLLIFILKSKYFYTLSKIFRILYYFEEILSDGKNIKRKIASKIYTNEKIMNENKLIDDLSSKVLIFYNNLIFHSSENSLLVLSHYIFNDLTKMPIKYGVEIFQLFHSCLENISNNNIENILNNCSHYLNNLYNYLEYLKKKEYIRINECLLFFFKCFYILSINIKSADYEMLIKNIRKTIINVNILFNIAKNYFKLDEEGVSEIIRKIEKENKYEIEETNIEKNIKIENGLNNGNNENINIDELKNKNKNRNMEIKILEEIFIIDLQLINDFYDFEINEQKEIILKLVDVHKIIYSLKFQNITHLALRTQMIRYVRKILIDMNYNKDNNYLYVNSIINNEDNLSSLKNNPLVNNYKYPTKLLTYAKDLWNLSIKTNAQKNINQNNNKLINELNKKITKDGDNSINSSSFDSFDKKKEDNQNNKNNDFNDKEIKSRIRTIKEDEELTSIDNKKSFQEDPKKNNLIKCFDTDFYDLLMNELNNVNDILSDINIASNEEMKILGEYFQNGLLIPIIFFFKKTFALAHNLTGTELVKLYDLVVQSINLKITISEFKYNFWNDKNTNENNFDDDLFCIHMINNKKDFLIKGNMFIDGEVIKKSNQTMKTLKNKNFSCFDYTLLYNIVEKNLFCLINEYSYNLINDLFSEKEEDIIMLMQNKPFSSLYSNNNINEKLYKIYILYKNTKNYMDDENNSSLFNILPEICIEYETNYRTLLVFILISNGSKLSINNNNNIYSISLYFLLYKLLSLQTSKTQTEIVNLLGGATNDNDNLGFMSSYSQHLMKRIILIFIDRFNPKDKYYNDSYIFTINLIKIFKFLCEEHNNFFQMRLIKLLNYQYKSIVPVFFKENKNFKEFQQQYETNTDKKTNPTNTNKEKKKNKNIKFFDFFLYVLLKITLISGWTQLKENQKKSSLNKKNSVFSEDENSNIYDLFSSIIELLNEIIQGNREEHLNRLGNPFFKEEENLSSEEDDDYNDLISMEINFLNGSKEQGLKKLEKLEKYKYKKGIYQKLRIQKDPFTCFLKGMISFIFIDNSDSQILYQLRNDLMQFFTSILEEKNCNEEVQKLIIKYLNIHRVFNSISSILKNYFLSNIPLDSLPADFFSSNMDKNIDSNTLSIENYLTQMNYTSIDVTNKENGNERNNNININILKEKLIFDHRLLNYYYQHFYSSKDFFISNEFQLTNAFYKYIKLIAVLDKNEELKEIIEEAQSTNMNTAIKKFEPNIINIKKENTKFFNNTNYNIQARLSKSLKNLKTIKEGKIKNRKIIFDENKRTKTEYFTNVQLSKLSKKTNDNFLSTIYSNTKHLHNLSLIHKGLNNNEEIGKSNICLSNIINKNNFIDNSDSSERVLGIDKKDNESLVNKLQLTNFGTKIKEVNNTNNNKNNNDKKDAINNTVKNDNKNINENNANNNKNQSNTLAKINVSTNNNNSPKQKTVKFREKRMSVFFKVKNKKDPKYPLIPDNTKEFFDKDYIERFYIVKFFESITSTIEVRNEESTNQIVIFTKIPEMIYLSKGTKEEFVQNVNRDSEISKKNDLVRHLEYFHKEIEYYKNNFSSLSHWFSRLDFYYVKWASYIYGLFLNLLILFRIAGDNKITTSDDNSYEILKNRRNDNKGIEESINSSINNWENIYNILNYIYIVLNGILIFIWIYFRSPLYYELDKIKYFEENIHKKSLNIKDKLYIIIVMTIYNRNYISSLIYEFIVSLVSSLIKRGEIIFPLLLLAIVDLNVTLKNVILSIKLRHKEFTLCFFLAFIFIYGLSNIAFFYYNDDFEQEIEYEDDNVCKTLIFCVLNALDSGLRARGGLGDSAKRISYMKNKSHYIERIILDDIFFFLIVIISIDLVFGIIIGEFTALREKTQKHETDRQHHCFICHVNKNTVEKNRQNFSVHINKEHNLWNYVSYMIYVKLSNLHDLNSINSYAREKIDNKDISWLPSCKDYFNNDKDHKGGQIDEDEDFRIEDENINNNYIVKPT